MSQKITKLSNDYTKQVDREKRIKQMEKAVIRKRMMLFTPLFGVAIISIAITAVLQFNNNNRLEAELIEAKEMLDNVNLEEEALLEEIQLLQDDNYLARIARSEFYMSEEGEIIFNLSDDEGEAN